MTRKRSDPIREAFENAVPVVPAEGAPQVARLQSHARQSDGAKAPHRSKQALTSRSGFGDVQVVCNERGTPVWCPATAIELFRDHLEWRGCLRHDLFRRRDMIYRPIPGSDQSAVFQIREIKDTDITQAQVWCNRNGFPQAKRDTVWDAFKVVAAEKPIDPLTDWLKGLSWDGAPRLSNWLATYLGVEQSDLVVEFGRRWMISAVARAFEPGCKADACLILEGNQGGGKSSALRILAGNDCFGDSLPEMTNKDAAQYLRGKWIIEMAELTGFRRADFESIKAFISREEERYRPPYGRNEITEPRRCVFAGTTNRDDYLRDPTGHRRFWPVRTRVIDLPAIQRDREQLWAEAVRAYQSSEPWWLTGEAVKMAAHVQAERGEDDPWIPATIEYCKEKHAVACKSILREAIGLTEDRMTQRETKRMGGILRSQGFERDGQFTSGPEKGAAKFVRTNTNHSR